MSMKRLLLLLMPLLIPVANALGGPYYTNPDLIGKHFTVFMILVKYPYDLEAFFGAVDANETIEIDLSDKEALLESVYSKAYGLQGISQLHQVYLNTFYTTVEQYPDIAKQCMDQFVENQYGRYYVSEELFDEVHRNPISLKLEDESQVEVEVSYLQAEGLFAFSEKGFDGFDQITPDNQIEYFSNGTYICCHVFGFREAERPPFVIMGSAAQDSLSPMPEQRQAEKINPKAKAKPSTMLLLFGEETMDGSGEKRHFGGAVDIFQMQASCLENLPVSTREAFFSALHELAIPCAYPDSCAIAEAYGLLDLSGESVGKEASYSAGYFSEGFGAAKTSFEFRLPESTVRIDCACCTGLFSSIPLGQSPASLLEWTDPCDAFASDRPIVPLYVPCVITYDDLLEIQEANVN